jgi:tRNA-specific 2-thiouridylase
VNWLGQQGAAGDRTCRVHVKIRSTRPAAPASLVLCAGDATVTLDSPEAGVAPGQACVFYSGIGAGAKVLGGGFIASASLAGQSGRLTEAPLHGRADGRAAEELNV